MQQKENKPYSKMPDAAADQANDFMDWIDNIIEPENTHTSPEGIRDQITRELQRYIAEPTSRIDCMKWWKTMEPVFPHVAVLARKYLCVPASSVPSERIFSLAGHLVCRRRAALKPENVNMLIFMNKNIGRI